MKKGLSIRDLHIISEGIEIVRGVSLEIRPGEVHALMGPNGSGKSTLANAIAGHPKYTITSGDISLDGQSIIKLTPDQKARRGLFLSFQYPVEIPGVKISSFLRAVVNARDREEGRQPMQISEFNRQLEASMQLLEINPDFAKRELNKGFSGGEKKRLEALQLAMLKPRYAILDETDSGLDIDSVKLVAESVRKLVPTAGILLITHYQRILKYIKPDFVHVMIRGRIVRRGTSELAKQLEEKGYDWLK